MGGIIGMSFLNSIFVDAMVTDNNDDVKEQLRILQQSVDDVKEQLKQKDK